MAMRGITGCVALLTLAAVFAAGGGPAWAGVPTARGAGCQLAWHVGNLPHGPDAAVAALAAAGPPGGEAGGGSVADAVNPLDFQRDLALWTAVVFLIVFLVLWRFAWRPIADGLAKREKGIADEIASADAANQKAQELLADYKRKLAQSEQEVRQMLDKARHEAEQVGHEIVAKARAEAQAEHERKLAEIDQAAAAAMEDIARHSASLAVELAGKIVASQLDPAGHARLVEQAVSRLDQSRPGRN